MVLQVYFGFTLQTLMGVFFSVPKTLGLFRKIMHDQKSFFFSNQPKSNHKEGGEHIYEKSQRKMKSY